VALAAMSAMGPAAVRAAFWKPSEYRAIRSG
jgi:hypothetical protein